MVLLFLFSGDIFFGITLVVRGFIAIPSRIQRFFPDSGLSLAHPRLLYRNSYIENTSPAISPKILIQKSL